MSEGSLHSGTLKIQATMREIVDYGKQCFEDGRKAALKPTELAMAFDQGWEAHRQEMLRQKEEPNHPITRRNPYYRKIQDPNEDKLR